jgi:hypothetical protein
MLLLDRVLYQTQVKATAGRDTRAVSADGVLDLKVYAAGIWDRG